MTPRRDPRGYVADILEAIANIEADTNGLDFSQFAADRRVRQLVERNVEIISEAHDYGTVRPDILWGIRTQRLTALKNAMQRLRDRLSG
jgi:uncharacterized protein with HEPN domain